MATRCHCASVDPVWNTLLNDVTSIANDNGHGLPNARDGVPKSTETTMAASAITSERIEWLWPGRVPIGMVTVAAGFPGVGKSTILYDLAARTTRSGKGVLIATAEDHLAAVVRPRLEAAGADLGLVRVYIAPLTLPDAIGDIRRIVQEYDVALVTVDPLVAFIGDEVNTHRDHHVRRVLAPLSELAEESRVACVVVIHTNKGVDTDPLMRISGSIGFTGAARSVLLAADDPQDEGRRILAVVKSNLAEYPAPLAYRLVGENLPGDITTSRVEWLGEAPEVDFRELLARRDPEDRSAREEAIEFLRASGVLQDARQAKELLGEAAGLGISDKTLQRARRALAIPAWHEGFQTPYFWGPRPTEDRVDTMVDTPTLSSLSSMELPAETGPSASMVDKRNGCPRCERYGPDHTGKHVKSWVS
ncbi:MAG: AAA family ATPase [Actinomycetota bacterium]|nr:AAA family ATPase [Actinomycetota bacterium]